MKIINTNTEWAKGYKKNALNQLIWNENPDVVCATEIEKGFYPETGYAIYSSNDYGYKTENRYKASLWSQQPWENVTEIITGTEPTGRFISGTTTVDDEQITFCSVCIPWSMANVSTGQKNKKRWEDHEDYLIALSNFLQSLSAEKVIILGDFNQKIPRTIQPEEMFDLLNDTFNGFKCITEGKLKGTNEQVLDHIFLKGFSEADVLAKSRFVEGKELTDHDIVFAEIKLD